MLEPPGLIRGDVKRPDGIPVAVETMGVWGSEATDFIEALGRRLTVATHYQ